MPKYADMWEGLVKWAEDKSLASEPIDNLELIEKIDELETEFE